MYAFHIHSPGQIVAAAPRLACAPRQSDLTDLIYLTDLIDPIVEQGDL